MNTLGIGLYNKGELLVSRCWKSCTKANFNQCFGNTLFSKQCLISETFIYTYVAVSKLVAAVVVILVATTTPQLGGLSTFVYVQYPHKFHFLSLCNTQPKLFKFAFQANPEHLYISFLFLMVGNQLKLLMMQHKKHEDHCLSYSDL